tara:strand:- start:1100 stop:2053 length:954 start_codon:yes stop_codon:yes gene_type:complete
MTQLHETGSHIEGKQYKENLHWMHGIDEYLTYINHPQLEIYTRIYNAMLHGNIWNIKDLISSEIDRGRIDLTDEFLNILLSHYTGYEYVNHRKVLRYISHCVDDDYIRKISSWSIKWQKSANLNDHFSRGQMKSKCWMVEQLNEVFPNTYLGVVAHYGGWYATVAKNIFNNFKVTNYYNLELDQQCIEIADDFNYEQYHNKWQFKSVEKDCGSITYDENKSFNVQIANQQHNMVNVNIKPNIVINTSCEHMNEDWFHNLPDGMLVCLQTNDYFSNEQHVNCVNGLNEAKAKYPLKEILYEGEIETWLYNRFMLIGEK